MLSVVNYYACVSTVDRLTVDLTPVEAATLDLNPADTACLVHLCLSTCNTLVPLSSLSSYFPVLQLLKNR